MVFVTRFKSSFIFIIRAKLHENFCNHTGIIGALLNHAPIKGFRGTEYTSGKPMRTQRKKPLKRNKAREKERLEVLIGFNYASDWLRA